MPLDGMVIVCLNLAAQVCTSLGVGGAVFSFTWGLAVVEAAAAKTVDGVGCAGATCCCMVAFWKQVGSLTLILNQPFIRRKDTTRNMLSTDVCQTYSTKLLALPWKRVLKIGREVPMKLGSWDRSHGRVETTKRSSLARLGSSGWNWGIVILSEGGVGCHLALQANQYLKRKQVKRGFTNYQPKKPLTKSKMRTTCHKVWILYLKRKIWKKIIAF